MSTPYFTEPIDTRSSSIPFDFKTFLVTAGLVGIGLISIYSATYDSGASSMFTSQLVFGVAGLFAMTAIAFVPIRLIRLSTLPLYLFGLGLLALVLVLGSEVNGAKSWFNIGSFSLQPSELAKFSTLMMAAMFVSQERRDLKNWRDLSLLILVIGLPIGLIMLEPDFGSASVYAVMLLAVAFWAGADLLLLFAVVAPAFVAISAFFGPLQMYITLAVVLLVMVAMRRTVIATILAFALSVGAGFSTGFVYQHVMEPHQKKRIETFLDPNKDPKGSGYHVIQSLLAVGSGGFTGKGFLKGTQTQLRYIPEQWTDFIFCVPAEEFGFVGGATVILLLTTLMWFAVDTAVHLRSPFESTICFGIAAIFLYHMSINIGMAIGVVPVMGIPLPFLSKGGSSLLLNMSMVGLLLNFYRFRSDIRRV